MTLAFHVLFLNFCIDNHGLFKMAGRIAQVNTAVVDMLRKIPTDPQDYINALKSVYEDYIKNESDLRNPDLSGGFIKSVTSWKYYCGLKHLYHLVFSGVERVAQYHPVIDFFKNLCVQVKAAKTQNDEQNLAAWFKIVKQAETPNVDVDLSALISSMQMSDSGAEKSALDGLMAAMGNMQVSTTYGEGGKARLITPEQMRMSGMGGVGAAFGPAVLRDQGGMGGAGAGYGSGPPGTQNM
ncbi:hypothetical protein EJ08DRAFT_627631 [Tothia fuscella]|uniref:Uncharacterized protein n=1 Tax=Tothia fuscella TaxID=1048955 RepID=A0A9P4U0Z8_9PEZI|nr:hypothetical protein EJ08DRAFT_627631 [Tothia fuscella]